MPNELRPVTVLNDELREKAARAIRHLEILVIEPQSIFVWNNLFFHDEDGIYATFHDFIDIQPDCFRTAGSFRVSLYWLGDEVVATSDVHNDAGYDIGLVDSEGRQWSLDACRTMIHPAYVNSPQCSTAVALVDERL